MDILVGSKDPILRRHLAALLGNSMGRVETTSRSGQVLVEALDHDFDLVILDTFLEGLEGQEILGILRQVRPRVPILFLHRAEEVLVVPERTGRTGILARSADDAELMKAVDRLCAFQQGSAV